MNKRNYLGSVNILTIFMQSGFNHSYKFVLVAGKVCKNHENQLTYIVRVRDVGSGL